MRKIKMLKGWGIYELTKREQEDKGFCFAPVHPISMATYGPGGAGGLTPGDADMECETLQQAIDHINSYEPSREDLRLFPGAFK